MRKALTFLVVMIFSVQMCGYYAFYVARNIQLHLDPIQRLAGSDVQRFKLSHEDFRLARIEDDELEMNGKMFDVIHTQLERDSVVVFVYRDKSEENLLGFLDELFLSDDEHHVDPSVNAVFQLVFLPSQTEIFNDNIPAALRSSTKYLFDLAYPFLNQPSPPPWHGKLS